MMPNRTHSRLNTSRSKALLLPMAGDKVADLVLRSRLQLERLRSGSIDSGLLNHMAQICIICGYIARAGYGKLPQERFDTIEKTLGKHCSTTTQQASGARQSLFCSKALTDIINEYDRMLGTVRLDLFANASDYLDRLIVTVATPE